jgi:hypothetical protein
VEIENVALVVAKGIYLYCLFNETIDIPIWANRETVDLKPFGDNHVEVYIK